MTDDEITDLVSHIEQVGFVVQRGNFMQRDGSMSTFRVLPSDLVAILRQVGYLIDAVEWVAAEPEWEPSDDLSLRVKQALLDTGAYTGLPRARLAKALHAAGITMTIEEQ